MTAPGIYVHGATTSLTRRTVLRKAFLAPWDPLVKDCFLYSLADAQRELGVAVHHSTLVVNHHHTSVTPRGQTLPELCRRLTRDTSVALHTLLCAHGYDSPRQLWDGRRTHRLRLLDAEAQASHLLYEYLNPVAAGLVARPEHMPGLTLDFGHWKTGRVVVKRPDVYFGKDRPAELELRLTPPPLLYRAFGGDLDALVHHMRRCADHALRELKKHRTRPPKGAKALTRIHPWSEPRTLQETGGEPVPTFRVGARGLVAKTRRIEAAVEVTGFRRQHHDARVARRDGDLDAVYPYGTYAAGVYRGELVEPEPSPDAIVTAPGPTLDDVRAELAEHGVDVEHHAISDPVREAWADEAGAVVEQEHLELVEPGSRGDASAARAGEPADTVVVKHRVKHRFARPELTRRVPRRVTTLRDARTGRPRKTASGRHAADPAG